MSGRGRPTVLDVTSSRGGRNSSSVIPGVSSGYSSEAPPRRRLAGGRGIPFPTVAAHPPGSAHRLLGRWVRWTVTGEMAGFVAPAVLGVVSAEWAPRAALPTMVAAGAVEGLLLGAAQAHALAPCVPRLRTVRFALLTAAAAALAYMLGMLPSAMGARLTEAPRVPVVLVGTVAALVLLASIGTAQWLELRRHVGRAWTWIATTAVAWLAGLVAFLLIATPLWHPGQRPAVVVLVGLVAAGAMATAVALVTGLALQRLLGRRHVTPRPRLGTPSLSSPTPRSTSEAPQADAASFWAH